MPLRRVLIISPNFPPINAPDHQRVRMSLPYFEEFGWRPTVLAVQPEAVEGTDDPLLARTVPADVEVVRTGALPVRWTRRLGLGSLALRALPAFWREGNRLLARERFDAVYFSTTMFAVMALGPVWRRRFGVPYILDFQDPWIQDYYDRPGAPPPPGGRFKHGFNQWLARRLEPLAMRDVSEVITVSPAYVETLRAAYPRLAADQFAVLPFGAPERDFEFLAPLEVRQTVFDPDDGRRHWVYVGRGGLDLAPALRIVFTAVAEARTRDPQAWSALRMHFVGTSYAPDGRAEKTIEPVARACGVGDLVEERTARGAVFRGARDSAPERCDPHRRIGFPRLQCLKALSMPARAATAAGLAARGQPGGGNPAPLPRWPGRDVPSRARGRRGRRDASGAACHGCRRHPWIASRPGYRRLHGPARCAGGYRPAMRGF